MAGIATARGAAPAACQNGRVSSTHSTSHGSARPCSRTARVRAWVRPRAPGLGLAALCFCLYLALSLARWHRGAVPSWDLAIFEQTVRGWAYHGVPIVDIKGQGTNQLGDHFSPLLALLAPFYRLFPSPVTLLVAQCALVAASVVPIARCARRHLGAWAGAGIGLAYGLSWGLQTGVDAQFHEYALAVPLLACGLAALIDGRDVAALAWMVPLFGVKEDLGLTVATLGVVLAIRGRRRLGACVAAGALAASVLVLGVVIPAFNGTGSWDYWTMLGGDEGGQAGRSLGQVLGGLLTPSQKCVTLVLVFAITGFVALASPIALLTVPTLAWRFAGDNPYYWGTAWHYSMILMPIVFAALIDGLIRLRRTRAAWPRWYARAVPLIVAVLPVAFLLMPAGSPLRFPLSDLLEPATYQASYREAEARAVLARIPDGARVATDIGLMARLTGRADVFWIGDRLSPPPDFVLIDTQAGWGAGAPTDIAQYASTTYAPGRYVEVYDSDGYELARLVR